MTSVVNIHEAKTHLSRLVDEVATGGKEIVIAKAGKPVARLTGIRPAGAKRKFGVLRGKVKIAKDFDAPLPAEVLDEFQGR